MPSAALFRSHVAMRLGIGACIWGSLALGGCLLSPSDESATAPSARQDVSPKTESVGEKASQNPGVPRGCTREWDSVARDSVFNCPDIRPPSPN